MGKSAARDGVLRRSEARDRLESAFFRREDTVRRGSYEGIKNGPEGIEAEVVFFERVAGGSAPGQHA